MNGREVEKDNNSPLYIYRETECIQNTSKCEAARTYRTSATARGSSRVFTKTKYTVKGEGLVLYDDGYYTYTIEMKTTLCGSVWKLLGLVRVLYLILYSHRSSKYSKIQSAFFVFHFTRVLFWKDFEEAGNVFFSFIYTRRDQFIQISWSFVFFLPIHDLTSTPLH